MRLFRISALAFSYRNSYARIIHVDGGGQFCNYESYYSNYCLGLASKEFYTNRRFGTAD